MSTPHSRSTGPAPPSLTHTHTHTPQHAHTHGCLLEGHAHTHGCLLEGHAHTHGCLLEGHSHTHGCLLEGHCKGLVEAEQPRDEEKGAEQRWGAPQEEGQEAESLHGRVCVHSVTW